MKPSRSSAEWNVGVTAARDHIAHLKPPLYVFRLSVTCIRSPSRVFLQPSTTNDKRRWEGASSWAVRSRRQGLHLADGLSQAFHAGVDPQGGAIAAERFVRMPESRMGMSQARQRTEMAGIQRQRSLIVADGARPVAPEDAGYRTLMIPLREIRLAVDDIFQNCQRRVVAPLSDHLRRPEQSAAHAGPSRADPDAP